MAVQWNGGPYMYTKPASKLVAAAQSMSRKFGAEEDFPFALGGLFPLYVVPHHHTARETVSEVSRLLIFHSFKLQK